MVVTSARLPPPTALAICCTTHTPQPASTPLPGNRRRMWSPGEAEGLTRRRGGGAQGKGSGVTSIGGRHGEEVGGMHT